MTAVGIIGYGSFGALVETLIKKFAPAVEVKIFSSRREPDGTHFFSFEEVALCDMVVPSVPIHAFEETVTKLLPLMQPESILVDVATVKVHTVEVLRRLAPERRWIATHPMFGPESFAKRNGDVTGFRIVLTEHTLPKEQYAQLVAALRACAFSVVEMSPEEHDKHLAETLFLTHLVGQIIARGNFGRTNIDTVSFGYLMDAVESVKQDTSLFQDVFRYNPYCRDVLNRFGIAEGEVQALLAIN